MPAVGRKPNEGTPVRHRVKPVHDWTEVERVPFDGAPEMPVVAADGAAWPAETLRWWTVISRMPHCVLWDDSDWQFAIDTIAIHARFINATPAGAATELRQREKILGTTMDARRDLRIRYVPAGTSEAESAGVTAIAAYKARIGGKGE